MTPKPLVIDNAEVEPLGPGDQKPGADTPARYLVALVLSRQLDDFELAEMMKPAFAGWGYSSENGALILRSTTIEDVRDNALTYVDLVRRLAEQAAARRELAEEEFTRRRDIADKIRFPRD